MQQMLEKMLMTLEGDVLSMMSTLWHIKLL